MPSSHRTVSALQDGAVVVDETELKAKNFQPEPWSGNVGSFTNVAGVAYQNGNGEIELLFVGTSTNESLAGVCPRTPLALIQPMIAQPVANAVGADAAGAAPWVPDAPTLIANNWTLEPIDHHPFKGTLIVANASGTPALVAFYRGAGQPVDVCA